jgi:hypothetical protein
MINGLRIGANEGGQQPSERVYLANWETPCARALPMTKFSRKHLTERPEIATSLPGSGKNVECDVTYRKQRTDDFLPGATTAQRRSEFLAPGPTVFAASQRTFSARTKAQQEPAAAPPDTAKHLSEFSRKYLIKTSQNYTKSNRNWPTNRSYRKQTIKPCLTGTRTAFRTFRFSTFNQALFCARASAFSSRNIQQDAATRKTAKYRALPQTNTQSLCGTITIWGTVRSHGTAGIV